MSNTKHIGRLTTNNKRVVVAYRVIPNDPDNAIIIQTESLTAEENTSLNNLIASPAGQNSYELAEAMARTRLPDGSIMLARFHAHGKLMKISTNLIDMTPNNKDRINLKELNEMIAHNKGVSVADLAITSESIVTQNQNVADRTVNSNVARNSTQQHNEPVLNENLNKVSQNTDINNNMNTPSLGEPLSDEELAVKYRADAASLLKEARRLKKEAEKLYPSKKEKETSD